MKAPWMLICLSFVSGCAFAPPDAYPIFEPDPMAFALFKAATPFDADKSAGSSEDGMLTGLRAQRAAYQAKANNALRGTYHQSEWSTGGAALGIAGGLIQNVATAVSGAVIGGGATVIGSRYRQAEQIVIYRKAASQTDCLLEVATNSTNSKYYDLPTVKLMYRQPITRGANYAVMDILAELRHQLDTLTPATADLQTILTQINNYRAIKVQSTEAQRTLQEILKNLKKNGVDAKMEMLAEESEALAALQSVVASEAALVIADFQMCVKTGKPVSPLEGAMPRP
jgi:hypothetical protein